MCARTLQPAPRLHREWERKALVECQKEDFIFYRKNLPGWERATRVVAGLVLIAWGMLAFPATTLGYATSAGGVTAILTGFFGFCPMCGMAGRTPPLP